MSFAESSAIERVILFETKLIVEKGHWDDFFLLKAAGRRIRRSGSPSSNFLFAASTATELWRVQGGRTTRSDVRNQNPQPVTMSTPFASPAAFALLCLPPKRENLENRLLFLFSSRLES